MAYLEHNLKKKNKLITKARSCNMVMSPLRQVVRDGRATGLDLSVSVVVGGVGTPDAFNPFLVGRHFLRLAIPCLVAAPPPTRLCCWMLVADTFASRFVYIIIREKKTSSYIV